MRRLLLLGVAVAALWGAPSAFAAGWCGSGEPTADSADVVTGRQVHAIWAVPSDGADTFAAGAAKLADDAASITTWWQGQDATRVPRFDVAAFPAGTCLDVSFVRLPRPAAEYASGASTAFRLITGDLLAAGYASVYKKYYVYFDGPSVQADVCGTGAGDFGGGPAYAVVWLQGCPDVATDNVGAHELLHALGALPFGAAHPCPGDSGHPCDSERDILYPYNDGSPLSAEVLDVNHDDYYGHSGGWIDIQDSLWLHLLVPQVALTLTITGTGRVASDVPGIACSAACTTQWDPGTAVDLEPAAVPGSRFVRWRGACTGRSCGLVVTAPETVTAVFGPARIAVTVSTAGRGKVTCAPRCSKSFAAGTPLTLRALPAKGWRFARWSGACTGTKPTCRPKTDYTLSARATFTRR
jgi:Divergent InlB B-repeat domain